MSDSLVASVVCRCFCLQRAAVPISKHVSKSKSKIQASLGGQRGTTPGGATDDHLPTSRFSRSCIHGAPWFTTGPQPTAPPHSPSQSCVLPSPQTPIYTHLYTRRRKREREATLAWRRADSRFGKKVCSLLSVGRASRCLSAPNTLFFYDALSSARAVSAGLGFSNDVMCLHRYSWQREREG